MTAPKPKLNKADFMFEKRQGEELIKKPGDINGIDFMIRYLEDCTVYILDRTAQVLSFLLLNKLLITGLDLSGLVQKH